jgi:hypothetical protein
MQNALNNLQDTNAMIINVQANGGGGGGDAISLAITHYFADQNRLAVSKYARS